MEIVTTSEVREVTVYPDRARLTAVVDLELDAGEHRVLVDELPKAVLTDSVRVGGRGNAQVMIASVDVKRSHYERTPIEDIRLLEDRIQELSDERRTLSDEQSVLLAQKEYLDGLRKATVQYAKGLARGKTKIDDYVQLAAYLQESDLALKVSVRELEIKLRELDQRLEKLKRMLQELSSGRAKQGYQAVIELRAENKGQFSLELSYVIHQAKWRPLYDIRLVEGADEAQLDITILAEINQNSGFDWNGVLMSVSTARPALSQRAPDLEPWYVDILRPQPLPRAARMPLEADVSVYDDKQVSLAMGEPDVDSVREAGAVLASRDQSGPSATFQIAGRPNIPGDGTPHKTTLSHYVTSPKMDYLTIPKLVDAAFKRIKVTNDKEVPFLAGQASLFAGTEYIGNVAFKYTAPGDEIELLFGTEDRISVERELVQREVEKTLLRDRRELNFGYEIKVHNLLDAPVMIEVQDHIPVSRNEEIKVSLERSSPKPAEHSDLNIITWNLEIPATEEISVQYEYLVTHPRQVNVVGLVD